LIAGWVATGVAAVAGGVFIGVSEVMDGVAKDEVAAANASARHACGSGVQDPVRCSAYESAAATSIDLRNAAIASFVGAGALGIGTLIYMGQRKQSPRVVVGVSSVNVVVPW
jgi:hypothetical protein